MSKISTADEVAAMIADGSTVGISAKLSKHKRIKELRINITKQKKYVNIRRHKLCF